MATTSKIKLDPELRAGLKILIHKEQVRRYIRERQMGWWRHTK